MSSTSASESEGKRTYILSSNRRRSVRASRSDQRRFHVKRISVEGSSNRDVIALETSFGVYVDSVIDTDLVAGGLTS